MKTKILNIACITLIICAFNMVSKAQDSSSVSTTFGVQTGFPVVQEGYGIGVLGHCELKLSKKMALRCEIGMVSHIYELSTLWYSIEPIITFEPRWYYNLQKRKSKSKNISGNSGNFVTIQANFCPRWFVINNSPYFHEYNIPFYKNRYSYISLIPTWGIKRNYGKHFTFETGIGCGFKWRYNIDNRDAYYSGNEDLRLFRDNFAINLHLRIGYRI